MNHPAKILVIIPCYNEEANIVSTVERLRATCPQVDFLIINDCSTDRSAELLAEHGYPFLDLPVNLGHWRAACSAVIAMPAPMVMMLLYRWTVTASTTPLI